MYQNFILLYGSVTFPCVAILFITFCYQLIELDCFHVDYYEYALNICAQVFFWTYVFNAPGYIYKSGHMTTTCLTFWGNAKLFSRGSLHFHSSCQWVRVPVASHPCQHILLSIMLVIAILVGVKWYLIVIFTSFFFMTDEFEHLFMCLLAI